MTVPDIREEDYATSGGALDRFANEVGHLLANHAGLTHFDTLGTIGSTREERDGISVLRVNGATGFMQPECPVSTDEPLDQFVGTVVRSLGLCRSVNARARNGGRQAWTAEFAARVVDRWDCPDTDDLLDVPDLRFRLSVTTE